MLNHFGAEQVAILDGGFQKWVAEGRPTESGEAAPRQAGFDVEEGTAEIVTKQQILSGEVLSPLLDARGQGRFEGSEPDPRPGVEPGHIPGAYNLAFGALYNEDGTFRPPGELRRLFAGAGIDPAQPFVASCGSGFDAGIGTGAGLTTSGAGATCVSTNARSIARALRAVTAAFSSLSGTGYGNARTSTRSTSR